MKIPSSAWRLVDAAHAAGAGLMLFDPDDRIVFSNDENSRVFDFFDFSNDCDYEDLFRACLSNRRFIEPVAYDNPDHWFAGAIRFRREHRFAQFTKEYSDGRTFIVTHEIIPGVGSYFSRIEVSSVVDQRRPTDTLFGQQVWAGLPSARGASTTATIGSLAVPAAVVTTTGMLLDSNAAMTALLAQRDGLGEVAGKLTAGLPAEQDGLMRLLAQAADDSHDMLVMRLTRERSEQPYLVNVAAAPSPFGAGHCRLATIIVLDPGADMRLPPQALVSLFGLTAAESRVAIDLGRGLRAEDVAQNNGTSLLTVRTQKKAIFSKLAISRESDLVRLITQMSAFFRPILKK